MKPKDFSEVGFDPGQIVQAQQQSALMQKLPPELRNRIYSLVLKDVVAPQIRRSSGPDIKPKAPGLLITCKQIHFEAIKLYWHESTFLFNPASSPVAWLRKIGVRRRKLLTDVRLQNAIIHGHSAMPSPLTVFHLSTQTDEAGTQLMLCEKGVKGVAPRVIKVDMVVPTPQGTMRVWVHLQRTQLDDTTPPASGIMAGSGMLPSGWSLERA